jgi:hypothetical protein
VTPSDGVQPEFVRGLAATWARDRNGNRFERSAFERTVRLFNAGRIAIPVLLNHDFGEVAGEVLELQATETGLEVTAKLSAIEALGRLATKQEPLGFSVGFAYALQDVDRVNDELVLRDGVLREVTIGTLAQQAVEGGGPIDRFDGYLQGMMQQLQTAGHAAVPGLCAHCTTALVTMVANPKHQSFDQLWHCPHQETTVLAKVRDRRVTGWHFLSPVSADEHLAMVEHKRREIHG